MTDQATILFRPAAPGDAEGIAAMFTDEGYPAGPSDIVARLERFATPEAQVIVAEHEGRPHWGKLHTRDLAYFRAVYPRLDEFRAVRDRVDPDRLMANGYLHRVLGP